MNIELIKRDDIEKYRNLILPVVYDELKEAFRYETKKELEYLCLVLKSPEPAAAIIAELEATGDINILSIYTLPEFRRKGYGTALVQTAVKVSRGLFQWDEGETEDDVILKTLFRLPHDMEEDFASFLAANGFTDFILLEDEDDEATEAGIDGEKLNVWSAYAEIHFFTDDTENDTENDTGNDTGNDAEQSSSNK